MATRLLYMYSFCNSFFFFGRVNKSKSAYISEFKIIFDLKTFVSCLTGISNSSMCKYCLQCLNATSKVLLIVLLIICNKLINQVQFCYNRRIGIWLQTLACKDRKMHSRRIQECVLSALITCASRRTDDQRESFSLLHRQ